MTPVKNYPQKIAETLIAQLKEGTAPWQISWDAENGTGFLPFNPSTGNRYKGMNSVILMSQLRTDTRWLTYRQALALNGQVRKGEKGVAIHYWKMADWQQKIDEKGQPVRDEHGDLIKVEVLLERPQLSFAVVFNAEQIEGLPPLERKPPLWDPLERAEKIIANSGAIIRHGAGLAAYQPHRDEIYLPDKSCFSTANRYYATLLHELGHWTGHSSRLDRDLLHPFNSKPYAREELRAEIASMMLGGELHIGHDPSHHAAYVASWISILREDPLEIFRAAADAEKIYTYVLGFEQQQLQEQEIAKIKETNDMPNVTAVFHSGISKTVPSSYEKIFLDVPFAEKEQVKALGARWDRQQRLWFIPPEADILVFKQWLKKETDAVRSSVKIDAQKDTGTRIYLVVPYIERLAAKAAGAQWDQQAKCWYISADQAVEKVARWLADNNTSAHQEPALDPREEFAAVLREAGCLVSGEHPMMDGKNHRIPTEGDKKGETAGFYVAHVDGHPAGYVKNHRTGQEIHWKSKGYHLTPAQKNHLQQQAVEKQQHRQAEQARQQLQVADQCVQLLQTLIPLTQPMVYLQRKKVYLHHDLFTDEARKKIYLPLYDENGKIWSVQTIEEDGKKRFMRGGRKEGCFHIAGSNNNLRQVPVIVIAEGYATAASLAQVLHYGVVNALDSNNLKAVALALHQKYPDKPIVIAADDDKFLEKTQGINPGLIKAEEAANSVGGVIMTPLFTPEESEKAKNSKEFTDFNDVMVKSVLGEKGLTRQVKTFVQCAIQQHQAVLSKKQALKRESFRHPCSV